MRYRIRDTKTNEIILWDLHGTPLEIVKRYNLATREMSHLQLEEDYEDKK